MGVAEVLPRRSLDEGTVEPLEPDASVSEPEVPDEVRQAGSGAARGIALTALIAAACGAVAAIAVVLVHAQLSPPLDRRVGPLTERLTGLDRQIAQVNTALGPVQAEIADLYDVTAGIAQHVAADDGQAAELVGRFEAAIARQAEAIAVGSPVFAVAVGQLRGVAMTGAPFEAELVTAYTLGGDDPRVADALEQLVATSRTGIPSVAELRAALVAGAAAAGVTYGADQGYYDYGVSLLSNYTGVVFESYAMANARDLLGYAERRLGASDVAGARDVLARIDPEIAPAMRPWFDLAEERLAAETALATLTQVVVGTLSDKLSATAAATPAEGGANAE